MGNRVSEEVGSVGNVGILCYDVIEIIVSFLSPLHWKQIEFIHPDLRFLFTRDDYKIWRNHFYKRIMTEHDGDDFGTLEDVEEKAMEKPIYLKKCVLFYHFSWAFFSRKHFNLEANDDIRDSVYSWRGEFASFEEDEGTVLIRIPKLYTSNNSDDVKVSVSDIHLSNVSNIDSVRELKLRDLVFFRCTLRSWVHHYGKLEIQAECIEGPLKCPLGNEYVVTNPNSSSCMGKDFFDHYLGKIFFWSGSISSKKTKISQLFGEQLTVSRVKRSNSNDRFNLHNSFNRNTVLPHNERTNKLFQYSSVGDEFTFVTMRPNMNTHHLIRMDLVRQKRTFWARLAYSFFSNCLCILLLYILTLSTDPVYIILLSLLKVPGDKFFEYFSLDLLSTFILVMFGMIISSSFLGIEFSRVLFSFCALPMFAFLFLPSFLLSITSSKIIGIEWFRLLYSGFLCYLYYLYLRRVLKDLYASHIVKKVSERNTSSILKRDIDRIFGEMEYGKLDDLNNILEGSYN